MTIDGLLPPPQDNVAKVANTKRKLHIRLSFGFITTTLVGYELLEENSFYKPHLRI